MVETAKKVYEKFKIPAKMIFDEFDRKIHESATVCFACKKKFDDDKVRDHCHYTGKYRGALHSGCNLKLGERILIIPVLAHNNSGYHSHMFVKRLTDTKGLHCRERGEVYYFQQGYPCGCRERGKGLRQTKIFGHVQVHGQVASGTGQNHDEVRTHGQVLYAGTTGTVEEQGGISVRLHDGFFDVGGDRTTS